MNATFTLALREYQLVELQRLATEAQTNVAGIVQGIVTMYLNGQVKAKKSKQDQRENQLIAAVLDAVAEYGGEVRVPNEVVPTKRRVGRPRALTDAQIETARSLRTKGLSYGKIAELVVDNAEKEYLIRMALTRNLSASHPNLY